MKDVLQTERLTLRQFCLDDAGFLLALMNEPEYHRFIGDRGLRAVSNAEDYIRDTLLPSYQMYGFGFWVMCLSAKPIGLAGIVKRQQLNCPDIGYALLSGFTGNGYVREAVRGILAYNRQALKIPRLQAITDAENHASIRVLLDCGFAFHEQQQVFGQEFLNVYELEAL